MCTKLTVWIVPCMISGKLISHLGVLLWFLEEIHVKSYLFVHHGNGCKIVQACIHSSLWEEIQQLNLTINMRLKSDEVDFAKYLLQLGNGTTPVHQEIGEDMVKVPNEYLVH